MALGALALGILLTGLLAVPLDLRLEAESEPRPRARAQVAWLFGLVRRDLGRGPRKERPPSRRRRRWPPPREWIRVWNEGLGERVLRLLRRLARWIRIHEMRIAARFGLGDPADTGMVLGALAPVATAARAVPHVEVSLEPDFADLVLAGRCLGELRIIPLGTLALLLVFAGSPTTWRALRALRPRPV